METYKVERRSLRRRWKAIALLVATSVCTQALIAKEWTVTFFFSEMKNSSIKIGYLSGTIDRKTASEAESILSKQTNLQLILLNSQGGDVKAAMEIGRLLRDKHKSAQVDYNSSCASACVLVLAGATQRGIYGPVVIHRPYFAEGTDSPEYSDIQNQYLALRSEVREYLLEMNVSPDLWDAMVSTSPAAAKQLTEGELQAFGLIALDPVEEELSRQRAAKLFGVTPAEIVRRQALVEKRCVSRVGANATHKEVEEATLTRVQCKASVMKDGY